MFLDNVVFSTGRFKNMYTLKFQSPFHSFNSEAQHVLRDILGDGKDERIFIGHGRSHEQAIKSIQNWVGSKRNNFTEKQVSTSKKDLTYYKELKIDYERPNLTMHGLRRAFARENNLTNKWQKSSNGS